MKTIRSILSICVLLLLSACTEWSSRQVAVPLELSGSNVESDFEASDGWRITLERAELAFGPLYLCAGITAGDLCDTARMEWLGSEVVNLLDPSAYAVGEIMGTTGELRSWMYDHGLPSRTDGGGRLELDAAKRLGGQSLVLRGVAERGSSRLSFSLDLQLMQHEETEQGIPLVRKSLSENFYRDVTGEGESLRIRFDPRTWFQEVNFDSYEGAVVPGETLVWGDDDQAFRALRNAVLVGERGRFSWFAKDGFGS